MTIEVIKTTQFRCPTCGHSIGEQEYKHACEQIDKKIFEASCKQIKSVEEKYKRHIQQMN
jgi:hypothetical protein